jgi:hypothetical protein
VRNPPLNDSIGANRDRIQVVKGWLDRRGELQEKVYDVVWSDKRTPGADGKLLAVGNTVEVPNATYSNSIAIQNSSQFGVVRISTPACEPSTMRGRSKFRHHAATFTASRRISFSVVFFPSKRCSSLICFSASLNSEAGNPARR